MGTISGTKLLIHSGRNKKSQPKSTRIRTNMNERGKDKPKRCSTYNLVGHSKNRCPHYFRSSS